MVSVLDVFHQWLPAEVAFPRAAEWLRITMSGPKGCGVSLESVNLPYLHETHPAGWR